MFYEANRQHDVIEKKDIVYVIYVKVYGNLF